MKLHGDKQFRHRFCPTIATTIRSLWKSHDVTETLSFHGKELTPFRGVRHEFQWKLHQHIRDEFVNRATRRKENRNNQG